MNPKEIALDGAVLLFLALVIGILQFFDIYDLASPDVMGNITYVYSLFAVLAILGIALLGWGLARARKKE
jgi:hypothetical protein